MDNAFTLKHRHTKRSNRETKSNISTHNQQVQLAHACRCDMKTNHFHCRSHDSRADDTGEHDNMAAAVQVSTNFCSDLQHYHGTYDMVILLPFISVDI